MPVLEIALVPCKQTLSKEQVLAAWKDAETIVKPTPGLLAMYSGFVTTHPGLFAAYLIWDEIQSHHKMQHGPAYGPFVMSVLPLLAGPIEVTHLDITDIAQLKTAMESPVLGTTVTRIQKGKVAPFLEAYKQAIAKQSVGPKHKAIWVGYSYEDPFSFYTFVGWESEQDHYNLMKSDEYQVFKDVFADYVDKESGVKIYHTELNKVYGDF